MADHKHNHKKIKKLSRKRIWPSIVLFVVTSVLISAIIMVVLAFFGMYMLENKMSDGDEYAKRCAAVVAEASGEQTTMPDDVAMNAGRITSALNKQSGMNAWAILDDENHVLLSHGVLSFEREPATLEFTDEHIVYRDTNETDSLFQDGDSTDRVLGLIWKSMWGGDYSPEWFNSTVLDQSYWTTAAIGDSELRVVVKTNLVIIRKDIFYAGLLAMVAMVIMFIVLLIMLVNLIFTIRAQRKITTLLYTDSTTCGKNWTYFRMQGQRILNRFVSRNSAKDGSLAIVNVRLLKYQSYCACNGIQSGECLLEDLHEELCRSIGKRELCAHYNGADFALLLRTADTQSLTNRLQQIAAGLPMALQQNRLRVQMGVMYIAPLSFDKKKRGKVDVTSGFNNALAARTSISDKPDTLLAFFDESLLEQQRWEQFVEDNMESALQNEEFVVYLQPKYNPTTDQLAGAEALVRWISPVAGFVPPYKFIPIFEKNGFVTKLDDYMISHVAALQSNWIANGKRVVPVSVNVSRAHFTDPDLADHIRQIVDHYGTPHEYVEIELTESAFFDDKSALLDTVNRLKSNGFDISMDDFGAGYSSLNSLKDLPLDVLKLDGEFFRGENEGERGEIVVSEAIRLAKSLHMRIVAEGVEKKEQVDFLAKQGCDMIQGYYYAKPMPVEEFESTRLEIAK